MAIPVNQKLLIYRNCIYYQLFNLQSENKTEVNSY